jgi:hypothetical protein
MVAGAAACMLAVVVLGGCTSARSNLGTSDSPCYLALPAAARAVGPHTRLVSVRLETAKGIEKLSPNLSGTLHLDRASPQRFCVIAFSGRFARQRVAKPEGRSSGPLAVAVLRSPSNKLVATVLFGHGTRTLGAGRTGPF